MSRDASRTHTDATGRQVWDKNYYAEKAAERASGVKEEQPGAKKLVHEAPKEHLKERQVELRLEDDIGRHKLVSVDAPLEQQGGFWCEVCECLLKDSASYLDHLNGKRHNRALGMTMRVKKATKEDVLNRLAMLKEKKKALQKKT